MVTDSSRKSRSNFSVVNLFSNKEILEGEELTVPTDHVAKLADKERMTVIACVAADEPETELLLSLQVGIDDRWMDHPAMRQHRLASGDTMIQSFNDVMPRATVKVAFPKRTGSNDGIQRKALVSVWICARGSGEVESVLTDVRTLLRSIVRKLPEVS